MLQQKFTVQVTTLPYCDDITRFDGIWELFIFQMLKKKICSSFQWIIELFTHKIVTKLSKIWVCDPGSEIRDPRVKKAPDPGSGSVTLFYLMRQSLFIYTCTLVCRNTNGGRWIISLDKRQRAEHLDTYWLEILFFLIGEHADQHAHQVSHPMDEQCSVVDPEPVGSGTFCRFRIRIRNKSFRIRKCGMWKNSVAYPGCLFRFSDLIYSIPDPGSERFRKYF
jgi:hypothetical protein